MSLHGIRSVIRGIFSSRGGFSMNKSSIWGLLCGLVGTALAFAYPRVFPTGVTLYDPARAYNSFVLFATGGDGPGQSYLIDMNGNEVHHWIGRGFPPVLLDPAVAAGARGHLLVQLSALDLPTGAGPT